MKVRLDQILVDKELAVTIEAARAMIGAGEVYVEEQISDKPGRMYTSLIDIRLKKKCQYVSRGGLKLEEGLSHFDISVANLVCIDIGASSGGFTDCLLQHGAVKVYAVDVAYGQLAWKIRQDPRVVVFERFNARNITPKQINHEALDFAVLDVSFISLTTLLPPVIALFPKNVSILALIKPQFELPREEIGAGGVVTEPSLHKKAIQKLDVFVRIAGLVNRGTVPSPILGPKGNREFLIHITS